MQLKENDSVAVQDGKNAWDIIESISGHPNQEDAFFVMDIKEVVKRYEEWTSTLPNIKPFYAVKCNDSDVVIKVLDVLGSNFDCASKGEINKVLNLGVSPDRIIYANPVKQSSHLRYAKSNGVNLLTFDSAPELHKVKEFHPNAQLIIRIQADSFDSQCPAMGLKFGVPPHKASSLVKLASSLDLNIVGISFHVGSGCREAAAYKRALNHVKILMDQCIHYGFNINLVDIGGGFTVESFQNMASTINDTLEHNFRDFQGSFIAEPGRFFVTSAYTLATRIHSMRVDKDSIMYYINDGLYGSFNCLLFDKATVVPIPLKYGDEQKVKSTIWGPTCDSLDMIAQDYPLPKMTLGDWIVFESMGAYTISASTTFNGFDKPKVHHFSDRDTWEKLGDVIPDMFTFDPTPFWHGKDA